MLIKLFPRMQIQSLKEQVASRDSFIYLNRGMSWVGWIPPKNKYGRRIYPLYMVISTVFFMMLLVPCMFVSYFEDLKAYTAGQFLTSLQVGVNCIGVSIKTIITFIYLKRFTRAKELLDIMDERCITSQQREQKHRAVAKCNRWYMYFHLAYTFYGISTFLTGVLNGRLSWKLYNPFIDAETHFWLAAWVEYIWMCGTVAQCQNADASPIIFTLILRAHIAMLKDRLQGLRTDPTMTEEENYAELIKCINDHHMIIEYTNNLRPLVSATIFTQFLLCGVVIGLACINIIYFSTLYSGISTFIFMCCLFMQTFPFCYICNLIITDCEELTYNIFHSNWLSADRRYKNTLIYFLHNIQTPIVLTAGGVFIISLGTNISVAKLAFSVVTFVKQLNIAEKFT